MHLIYQQKNVVHFWDCMFSPHVTLRYLSVTFPIIQVIGNVKPIKVLDKNDHFQLLLSQIGSTFSVSADVKVELEEFVCLLYSQKTPQTDQ